MIHNFCINDFEGPLDLLLHLIRSSKMDIYDINIESITRQYLEFINNNKDLSMDDSSEYLVMAAELIHLKSKLLLNKDDDEDEESEFEFNSEEDLKMRLLEYEKIKGLTDSFKELEDKRSEFYTKLPSDLSEYKKEEVLNYGENDLDDLINAFELFLSRQKLNKPLNTKIMKKELSHFEELFEEFTKPYVVVTFLSILEMAKNNEILIKQDNNFGEISIEMK